MSRVDWGPLAERIRAASSIVLTTHINADGDGIGCEIALHHFLDAMRRRHVIVNNEPIPERYRFLRGSEAVEVYDAAAHSRMVRGADLVIVLDNSSVERLARLRADVEAARGTTVCIDHHSMVNPFWRLNCVDTGACASGQLVHELILRMGGAISAPIAEALYVSVVTDTGQFRFSKTTSESHRLAADLIDAGAISPPRFHSEIYERISPAMAALTGLALTSLRREHGGRFVRMILTRAQVAACGGEEEDTGDLVNLGLAIRGVVAGALFREMPDGRIKVSLRSKGDLDVHALAARFHGGGHRNASGILMDGPLQAAIDAVVEDIGGRLAASAGSAP